MSASGKSPSRKGLEVEAVQQLRAARQWLEFLAAELGLDPEGTAFVVTIVSPAGEAEAARVTLAHSLAQIDACLAEAPA